MPTLTRDLADSSTSFLPHISDCPMARPSVCVRGLNHFASFASHVSITEIAYLSIKIVGVSLNQPLRDVVHTNLPRFFSTDRHQPLTQKTQPARSSLFLWAFAVLASQIVDDTLHILSLTADKLPWRSCPRFALARIRKVARYRAEPYPPSAHRSCR